MGKKKITSSDIAREVGVSQSTVSMILNKKCNVSFSKETVKKVEETAKRMGYVVPKRKIRKSSRKEKVLVTFCPNLTNPYYVMLLQGIESRANEQGYGLFICNTQRNLKMEERYLKMMPTLQPSGIIYMCNPANCFMEQVEQLSEKIPIVIINNQNEQLKVDAVELNNEKLGRIMAKHLLELGHRKVAYIAPPLTRRQKQRFKRVDGFLKEFEKKGLRSSVIVKAADEKFDKNVQDIDSEYRIGYELTKELLKEEKGFTAVVGLNDMIAFGILEVLEEEKYKVPNDISVMGCDNVLFSKLKKISLTTIEHFAIYKGRDACDIIMQKILSQEKRYSEIQPVSIYHVEYEPRIIPRGTTSYAKVN